MCGVSMAYGETFSGTTEVGTGIVDHRIKEAEMPKIVWPQAIYDAYLGPCGRYAYLAKFVAWPFIRVVSNEEFSKRLSPDARAKFLESCGG